MLSTIKTQYMLIHNIFNSIYAMKLCGKFSFVSQEGDGSTFFVNLPL